MSKRRILFAGDSIIYTTGLAYVILSLIKQYYKTGEYEIGFVAISGKDVTKEEFCQKVDPVLGENIQFFNAQIMDANKAVQFDQVINQFNPSIVISMVDPWIQDQIAYSSYRKSFYWVNYVTIETPKYPEHCLFPTPIKKIPRKSLKEIMGGADLLIPCTQMGKECLEGLGLNPIDPISLGIDLQHEYKNPVSKSQSFGSDLIHDDDFIFFTVATNSERKMLAKILESFYKFKLKVKDEKNRYKIYIHTDVLKQQGGTDLQSVVAHYNLNSCVIFPMGLNNSMGIPKEELYKKIKSCDCFVGLSGGEGFGYGYIEAMLHQKPVIYIDYGGHKEFCKDCGLPVKVHDFTYAMNADIRFALADTDDCARQMARMTSDKNLAEKLGAAGYQVVQRYSWDIVGKQFIDTVDDHYKKSVHKAIYNFKMKRIV